MSKRELLEPLADSDEPDVLRLRVAVLAQTGELDQALKLLDQRINQGGASVELILQKAELQLRNDQTAAAERTLLDALNAHPQDERLYTVLLNLYHPSGDQQSPIDDAPRQWQRLVQRLLRTIPDSRRGRLVRAQLQLRQRHFPEAQQLLEGLLDEDPLDLEALQHLLSVYYVSNRRDQAVKLLEDKIKAHPEHRGLLIVALGFFGEGGIDDQAHGRWMSPSGW